VSGTSALVRDLADACGPDAVATDESSRERAAHDFSWLSPVLARDLPRTTPDVVVSPATPDDAAQALAVAHAHSVPVVARGAGTGNYGQAVPFARGVVLDMSRCDEITAIGPGHVEAGAGISFASLAKALAARDREPVVFPSMTTSLAGGFLSGGNQGIGSITYGSIWDGWVRWLEVAACRAAPSVTRVEGEDLEGHLHAFGTAGVLTRVSLDTAPRRDYTAVYAAFGRLGDAAAAGLALMRMTDAPRALSIDDEAVYRTFPPFGGHGGAILLRAVVTPRAVAEAMDHIRAARGEVTVTDGSPSRVFATVYNHAMLRAKNVDDSACALQIRGPAIVAHEQEVRECLPDVRLHLDGNAPRVHGVGYSGLLISRWAGDAELQRGIDRLTALGVIVISPHTWLTGGHGHRAALLRAARAFDPAGLLNPGKLAP
jgi:FAD/FMN-containing dehydrogenase